MTEDRRERGDGRQLASPPSARPAMTGSAPLSASSTSTATAPRLPERAQRVGRADVAAAFGAQVAPEEQPRDDDAERDRAQAETTRR